MSFTGGKTSTMWEQRAICGPALALGLGISLAKDTLSGMGEYVQMFFGESSIILVAGFAIILNLILPKDQTDKEVEAEYIREISQTEDDAVSETGAG